MWGTSTSAYQIEGGLQWEGRGPSTEDGNGVGTAFDGNVSKARTVTSLKSWIQQESAVGSLDCTFVSIQQMLRAHD